MVLAAATADAIASAQAGAATAADVEQLEEDNIPDFNATEAETAVLAFAAELESEGPIRRQHYNIGMLLLAFDDMISADDVLEDCRTLSAMFQRRNAARDLCDDFMRFVSDRIGGVPKCTATLRTIVCNDTAKMVKAKICSNSACCFIELIPDDDPVGICNKLVMFEC
jgi:hypothetical protein